jgi:hypothetical protein
VVRAVSALAQAVEEGRLEPHADTCHRGSPELLNALASERVRQQQRHAHHLGPAPMAASERAYGHLMLPHLLRQSSQWLSSHLSCHRSLSTRTSTSSVQPAADTTEGATELAPVVASTLPIDDHEDEFVRPPAAEPHREVATPPDRRGHMRRLTREGDKESAAKKIEAVMRGRLGRQQTRTLRQARHSERLLHVRYVFVSSRRAPTPRHATTLRAQWALAP